MRKRKLGISVYPEKFELNETKNYIFKCNKYGFEIIFMSLIHLSKPLNKNIKLKYDAIYKYAKTLGMYIILDVDDSSLDIYEIKDNNFNIFHDLGIGCLRFDVPMKPQEIANAMHINPFLDFQINMSNNDNFINNILDFKPILQNLGGCHNFYPLKYSGLDFPFFQNATKKFLNLGLETAAFVGSDFGWVGPQNEKVGKLVTLEINREMPIVNQVKFLLNSNLVSMLIVGNQPMEEKEMIALKNASAQFKVELDIDINEKILSIENEIINFDNHFRRGDINSNYIRSTLTRIKHKDNLIPNIIKCNLKRGDICIINCKNTHYQNELIIILKDGFINDGTLNFVASISKNDIQLLDFIEPWSKFIFNKNNEKERLINESVDNGAN